MRWCRIVPFILVPGFAFSAISIGAQQPIVPATLPSSKPSQQHLKLDLAATAGNPFLGLGVQFDPYTHPVETQRWALILDHLTAMQPGFYRVMSGASDYCSGFDAAGRPQYRWQSNLNDPALKPLFDVLDFAQKNGTAVYLGEWFPPKALGIRSPDDPRWARIIADFVQYLVHERHYSVVQHYILMNEPNGQWMWPGSSPDYAAWSRGVRQLRRELDVRGLGSVLISGPDNSGDPAWFRRTVTEMHDTIGSWEQHIYAKDDQVSTGAVEQQLIEDGNFILKTDPRGATKDRFLAESGLETGKLEDVDQQPRVRDFDYGARMADYVLQVARAGWGGADAWDLDDAMHTNGHGGLKIWGFFDSTTDAGMTPRPWYYAWTMLSHALPRGASIVPLGADSAAPVRAVAARWTRGGVNQWSIVMVNHTDAPTSVSITIPATTQPIKVYRYFANERPATADGEPAVAATLEHPAAETSVALPSRGVVVFTTEGGAGK